MFICYWESILITWSRASDHHSSCSSKRGFDVLLSCTAELLQGNFGGNLSYPIVSSFSHGCQFRPCHWFHRSTKICLSSISPHLLRKILQCHAPRDERSCSNSKKVIVIFSIALSQFPRPCCLLSEEYLFPLFLLSPFACDRGQFEKGEGRGGGT